MPRAADEQRQPTKSRSQRRSKIGCPECRKRKVKCDERRPTCGQCQKSGRSCHIVDNLFKTHVLSSNTADPEQGSEDDHLTSQEADLSRHGDDALNEGQPRGSATQSIDEHVSTDHLAAPAETERSNRVRTHIPTLHNYLTGGGYVNAQRVPGVEEAAFLLPTNEGSEHFLNHSPGQIYRSEHTTSEGSALDKLEEGFFMRHFSEHIAPWFDVVNFQRYFGHECIVILRENSLLLYATCALAAKQLGQSSVISASSFENAAQRNIAQQLLRGNLDFLWYGAKYYDKAIKTLARQITLHSHQITSASPVPSPAASLPQSDMMTRAEGEDPIVRLLATCLLIQYENLGGNTKGWSGHLNGFSKLLSLLDDGSLFYTNPLSQQIFDAKSQRALRAAFWWYAINDMEESFVARRKVRIDLNNLSLWRHMGLHMHEDGELVDLDSSGTPDAPPHLQEDLLSFALIRLVGKLIDHLFQRPSVSVESPIEIFQFGSASEVSPLQSIESELDRWSSSSTAAFRPDNTWLLANTGSINQRIFGCQTWYSHCFRAVTMMYYHMARMLLLIHQPPTLSSSRFARQGSSFDLLFAVRELEQRLQNHARGVISIATGMRDCSAVRVRGIQPLYVAGRTLRENQDRRRLVEIIRSIQDDLGIFCEYRVEHLMEEWGISFENLNLERRVAEPWLSDN